MRSAFLLALLVALVTTMGCQPSATNNGPEKTETATHEQKTPTPDPSQDKTPSGVETGPNTCKLYIDKLCETVGNESPTCSAANVLTDVLSPKACAAGIEDMEFTKNAVAARQGKCDELLKKVCADIGEDSATCGKIKEVFPTFPAERCIAMLDHYDEFIVEVLKQEEANKPLDAEKQALIAAKDAPSFGPDNAPVTIVEFSDFECPYCTLAADVATQIKKKYPNKVRFVYRNFPLSFHPNAHLAAQAALEANKQGKFWPYHDLIFANQKQMSRTDLEKYAKQAGLNLKAFKKALDDKTHAARVDADMALGGQVTVQGTPSMFLNGKRVQNPTSFEFVAEMIEAELK